eukprot:7304206-Prymnesium_polylepis.1
MVALTLAPSPPARTLTPNPHTLTPNPTPAAVSSRWLRVPPNPPAPCVSHPAPRTLNPRDRAPPAPRRAC